MKKTYKTMILVGLMIIILTIITACSSSGDSVTSQETKAVTDIQQEMNRQVGMPMIDDFFEKKMAKQIFELRDNSELITYCYMTNLEGKFIYLGKCIGFGLPYSVQYTNPQKLVDRYGDAIDNRYREPYVISQADPNGLYMPEGLSATWLMLLNEKTGEPEIIYTEPSIVVTQSKLPKRLVADWSLPNNY